MPFHVYSRFSKRHALGFKQFALQAGIRFANQELPAVANDTMPGNAFA